MKNKLLVIELWALGDLVVATPFLRAAAQQFEVSLLAKPAALELQPRLWPGVEVIPFILPWTVFKKKYALYRWPWRDLGGLVGELRRRKFDVGVSARWDPRDHFLLAMGGARRRAGFPRLGSGLFLTDRLPPPQAHRYDNWRTTGRCLGLELPERKVAAPPAARGGTIVIHSGAAQPARVWPLERFQFLAEHLRGEGYAVEVVCNLSQKEWWEARGEKAAAPEALGGLLSILERAGLFIGNDSGPGHLAGILGVPTFTLFGNQFPESFLPLDAEAEWLEGADCDYKPCYDTCRYAHPECLWAIGQDDAWRRVKAFAARHIKLASAPQ